MNVSRPVFNREKHAEFFTVLKKRVKSLSATHQAALRLEEFLPNVQGVDQLNKNQ